MSGGGGKEPSTGAGRREEEGFWGFWADIGFLGFGSLPKAQIQGPRQRCFYFFKKILCRVPLAQHSAKTVFAECQAGTRQIFSFFCFFDPKFFVGPAYIVYNFMFKFGAFSSFFVIFG